MKTTYQTLRHIQEILQERPRWSRHSAARARSGAVCTIDHPDAYAFDLINLVMREPGDSTQHEFTLKRLRKSAYDLGWTDLIRLNDIGGYLEVIQVVAHAVDDEKRRARDFS